MKSLIATCFVCAALSSGMAQLPDSPSAVVDKKFTALTLWNASAVSLDAYTTVALVGHTQTCPYEVWSASLYGQKPQPVRVSAVMGAKFAVSVLASYELKKHHVHLWKLQLWTLPQAYNAYGHTLGAVHNFRTCH